MSPQREAQHPSASSEWAPPSARGAARYAPRLLIALVFVHLASQMLSALGPRNHARWHESRTWVLIASVCWLWSLVCAGRAALRPRAPTEPREQTLATAERAATAIVIAFALLHGAGFAWRSLSGELLPSELRAALIASLSSTSFGLPLLASTYLSAVGCAAFLVARSARRELEARTNGRAFARRAAILLGIFACALGLYAVLVLSTGSLIPW